MAHRTQATHTICKSFEGNRLRSSVFYWMVKYHDEIVEQWDGNRIDWRSFCSALTELGLTDTKGKPITERNARETWFQARKYLEAKRAAVAALPPKRIPPSRMRTDWRPVCRPPLSDQLPSAEPNNESVSIRKNASEKKTGDADAQIARMLGVISKRDS